MRSSSSPEPPPEVVALAAARARARDERDFAAADRLRDEIADAGWLVTDTSTGPALTSKPPYDVLPSVRDLPDNTAASPSRQVTVSLLVEGWPDDVRRCLDALLTHTTDDVVVQAIDVGDVDGAGAAVHEFAGPRLEEWHVATGPAHWAAARTAALRADVAATHVWCEVSTVLAGDAITPLLATLGAEGVLAAGWRGVDVDLDDDWRSFVESGPGDVDALLGYLLAMRRDVALAAGGPHPKARFYRNADIEFSFALREAGRRLGRGDRLVAVPDLPCRQERHHGYHDSDPAYRDAESAKTYGRFLQRFRGRSDLLAREH